ncbi:MAG: hypothetical protein HYX76_13075 [Acidobacteria bacterium]|nr:hypothetical protein [Acidobacteriota bacterium]
MDPLLLITISAIAIAVTMTLVTFRMMREERRRSAARIAALNEALERGQVRDLPLNPPRSAPVVPEERLLSIASRRRSAEPAEILREQRPTQDPVAAPRPEPAFDLDLGREPEESAATAPLFGVVDRPGGGSRRIGTVLLAAAVAAALVGAFVFLQNGTEAKGGAVLTRRADGAPLELRSLRHTRDKQTWTITGLVRNPAEGAPASRVTAVAFLFDGKGSFVASGRAPVDFTNLGPGDESPFVVNVTALGPIARYRISFRAEDGQMIRHVDRRAQ